MLLQRSLYSITLILPSVIIIIVITIIIVIIIILIIIIIIIMALCLFRVNQRALIDIAVMLTILCKFN